MKLFRRSERAEWEKCIERAIPALAELWRSRFCRRSFLPMSRGDNGSSAKRRPLDKKDAAIRLPAADAKLNFCVYPAVDHDPMFDKIRQSPEFRAARQAGVDCQRRFAPYSQIQIQ
jgi:hypothetical protein